MRLHGYYFVGCASAWLIIDNAREDSFVVFFLHRMFVGVITHYWWARQLRRFNRVVYFFHILISAWQDFFFWLFLLWLGRKSNFGPIVVFIPIVFVGGTWLDFGCHGTDGFMESIYTLFDPGYPVNPLRHFISVVSNALSDCTHRLVIIRRDTFRLQPVFH